MRPRVFPAEDRLEETAGRSSPSLTYASMRPRVFPAEDTDADFTGASVRGGVRFNEAAGIPRGRPALRAQPAS